MPRKASQSRKALEKRLDEVFSEYIRRRHADKDGIVECVTCGKKDHWKSMDAGHFWKRQYRATRWHPCNAAVQCARCNRFRGGAEAEHATYILKTYGDVIFNELHILHLKTEKMYREDYLRLIEEFKRELEELNERS